MASNFDLLAKKLSGRPGVTNPAALAAAIGRRKDGAAAMAKGAATGRPAASFVKAQNPGEAGVGY